LPDEAVTRDQQEAYYAALSAADQLAESTPFVEFMLESMSVALSEAVRGEPEIDSVTDLVTDPVETLLSVLNVNGPRKISEWIEMTQPESPSSPAQKYRLTQLGKQVFARLKSAKKH
jgi:hypothetical protein